MSLIYLGLLVGTVAANRSGSLFGTVRKMFMDYPRDEIVLFRESIRLIHL